MKINKTADMKAYQRAYRMARYVYKRKIINTEPPKCDCGQLAIRRKDGNNLVCARCHDLEGHAKAFELRQRSTIRERSIKWNEDSKFSWVSTFNWIKMTIHDSMQPRIKSWIEDKPGELVVHGHGEYHLALQ